MFASSSLTLLSAVGILVLAELLPKANADVILESSSSEESPAKGISLSSVFTLTGVGECWRFTSAAPILLGEAARGFSDALRFKYALESSSG